MQSLRLEGFASTKSESCELAVRCGVSLISGHHARRMAQNLDMSKGLIVGEAVMMGLAPTLGRNPAHDVVYEACKRSIESGSKTSLYDELVAMPNVVATMGKEKLAGLCDPRNYLGSCRLMVDEVLDRHSRTKVTNAVNGHTNRHNGHTNGVNGHH